MRVGDVVVCGMLTFLFRCAYTGKDGGKAKPLKAPKVRSILFLVSPLQSCALIFVRFHVAATEGQGGAVSRRCSIQGQEGEQIH
jgi:hypothetical protein